MKLNRKTLCIHAPDNYDKSGTITPIDPSTANRYRGAEDEVVYPRYFNTSNQKVLCRQLAALENADRALVFGSGMAAISTIFQSLIKQGDHVLFPDVLYGGTHNYALNELPKLGASCEFADAQTAEEYLAQIKPNTRIVYLETPANPLLTITDLKTVTAYTNAHNIITVIDNTFASPINQNPIDLGVDIIMHSGTKYLCGHSDLCFGAVMCSELHYEKIYKTALSLGGSLNGLDFYIIERSLKTLALRVNAQSKNALEIAQRLKKHESVSKVHYPGLESFRGHEIAKQQMKAFGGMLSFEIEGASLDDVKALFRNLKLVFPAGSLGGVETTITSPTLTSHLKMSPEQREKAGIKDNLLRLSVGAEEASDIIQDLEQALLSIRKK